MCIAKLPPTAVSSQLRDASQYFPSRGRDNQLQVFFGQTLLIFSRAQRGLPMDPRSLRNLALLAEQLSAAEERAT
jgi:hypothetical protein